MIFTAKEAGNWREIAEKETIWVQTLFNSLADSWTTHVMHKTYRTPAERNSEKTKKNWTDISAATKVCTSVPSKVQGIG